MRKRKSNSILIVAVVIALILLFSRKKTSAKPANIPGVATPPIAPQKPIGGGGSFGGGGASGSWVAANDFMSEVDKFQSQAFAIQFEKQPTIKKVVEPVRTVAPVVKVNQPAPSAVPAAPKAFVPIVKQSPVFIQSNVLSDLSDEMGSVVGKRSSSGREFFY